MEPYFEYANEKVVYPEVVIMLKKSTVCLAITLLFLLSLPFIIPMLGKVSKKDALRSEAARRKNALLGWKRMIEEYQTSEGVYPDNLYQLAKEVVDLPSVKVGVIYYGPIDKFISDPSYFIGQVEFEYYKNEESWLIVEKSNGELIDYRFMIDNKGGIYTVSSTPPPTIQLIKQRQQEEMRQTQTDF